MIANVFVVEDPERYGTKVRYYKTRSAFINAIVKGQGTLEGYHFEPEVPHPVFGKAQVLFADARASIDLTYLVHGIYRSVRASGAPKNNIYGYTDSGRKQLAQEEKKAKVQLEKDLINLGL